VTTKERARNEQEFQDLITPIPEKEMTKICQQVERIIPLLQTAVRRKKMTVEGVVNKMDTFMKNLEFIAYED